MSPFPLPRPWANEELKYCLKEININNLILKTEWQRASPTDVHFQCAQIVACSTQDPTKLDLIDLVISMEASCVGRKIGKSGNGALGIFSSWGSHIFPCALQSITTSPSTKWGFPLPLWGEEGGTGSKGQSEMQVKPRQRNVRGVCVCLSSAYCNSSKDVHIARLSAPFLLPFQTQIQWRLLGWAKWGVALLGFWAPQTLQSHNPSPVTMNTFPLTRRLPRYFYSSPMLSHEKNQGQGEGEALVVLPVN